MRVLKKIWTAVCGGFAVVGLLATLGYLVIAGLVAQTVGGDAAPPALPDTIVLSYVFKPGLAETVGRPALGQNLLHPSDTLHEMTAALKAGAADPRVKGFIARIEGPRLGLAQVQELRAALAAFRKTGKFAFAFSEGFSPGVAEYYLASAFGKIWLQPVGGVAITGIAAELPFGREALDKLGVRAEFSHKGKYKSYPETMTRTGMSDPNREMMTALIGDLSEQVVAGVAESRALTPADVRARIDAAPFTDTGALKAGLIDVLGYEDEMRDAARAAAGIDDKGFVPLGDYSKATEKKEPRSGARIALITGAGDIVSGSGAGGMAAGRIAAAFKAAQDDADVAAVVLRIDSPGGSPEAAETMRRAIVSMRAKGRPVIVSMGGYAASGGYWVASAGDTIVADPATITGSIGVFGGKMDLSGLWRKVGLNWDGVAAGANARMWSSNKPFSAGEMARFDAQLDGIYDAFIARVAEGRRLPREKVLAVAEGRVWTGAQAKERGLVDVLGTLDTALDLARAAAKLAPDAPVVEFPRRKSGLQALAALVSGDDEVAVLPALETALRRELGARTGVVRLPVAIVP